MTSLAIFSDRGTTDHNVFDQQLESEVQHLFGHQMQGLPAGATGQLRLR